jgi:hypothetical protein
MQRPAMALILAGLCGSAGAFSAPAFCAPLAVGGAQARRSPTIIKRSSTAVATISMADTRPEVAVARRRVVAGGLLALLTLPKSASARGVGMRVPKGLHVASAARAAKSSSGILRQTAKGTIGGQSASAPGPGTASDPWKNPSRKDTCPIKGACAPK